jgi:hypothetical protein
LKRELKVLEIAKREANEPSHFVGGTPGAAIVPNNRVCLNRAPFVCGTVCGVNPVPSDECHNQFGLCEKPMGKVATTLACVVL